MADATAHPPLGTVSISPFLPLNTSEIFLVGRWMQAQMLGDTRLMGNVAGVYRSRAPFGAALPYVIYDMVSGVDALAGFGAIKTHVNCVYRVEAFCAGTAISTIEIAIRRIYDVLTLVPARGDLPIETSGGIVYDCVRESTRPRGGVDQGDEWSSVLQEFRVHASAI
jgi:hypothetical protein